MAVTSQAAVVEQGTSLSGGYAGETTTDQYQDMTELKGDQEKYLKLANIFIYEGICLSNITFRL